MSVQPERPAHVVVAESTARLLERYLHEAKDADQRAQLVNLACLLRHSTAMCAALASDIADYQNEAMDEWAKAQGLSVELVEAEREIARLTRRLAEAENARDTANAVPAAGGVR